MQTASACAEHQRAEKMSKALVTCTPSWDRLSFDALVQMHVLTKRSLPYRCAICANHLRHQHCKLALGLD